MLYLHLQKKQIDISKYKSFLFVFYAVFPLGTLLWLSAYLFYSNNFEKPSLAIAVFAAFAKSYWGILGAVMSIGFLAGVGGIVRKIFYLPIFQTLGRLTYCIYLVHMCVLRFLNGANTMLPNVSVPTIVSHHLILDKKMQNIETFFLPLDPDISCRILYKCLSLDCSLHHAGISFYSPLERVCWNQTKSRNGKQ